MATQANAIAPTKIADISAEITESGLLHVSFGASGNTITIDPAALSPSIARQATLHGLKQKLVDAAAIARDTTTGRSATSADKEAAVREVYDRITSENGTWNKIREAGATAVGGLLVAALMEMTGKDKPAILKFLETKSAEEKAALRKNQKVAEIILKLQSAKVNTDIDTDALLGDLMGSASVQVDDEDIAAVPNSTVEAVADEVEEETHAKPRSTGKKHAATATN